MHMVKFYSSLFIFPIFLLAVRGIEGQAQVAPLPTDTFRMVVPDSIRLDDEIAVGYATGNQRTMSGSVDIMIPKTYEQGICLQFAERFERTGGGGQYLYRSKQGGCTECCPGEGNDFADRRERPGWSLSMGFLPT